ncbi:MAG: TIGR03086 family metal-binding protein [Actinomycetota bacterium]|nr:TIGR03086 family metal-binding protein [Actinomycetota bacterium]
MELLDALSQTFDHAGKIVGGVKTTQLGAPTPCTEWDVQTLVAHTLGVIVNMGRGARGEELLAHTSLALDADLGTQFRAETDRTLAAWIDHGLDGDVNVGAGPMPARAAISVNLVDSTTHSWDIARATGQDAHLPDELAATVLAVGRGFITDDLRKRVGFDAPVPVARDAGPTDQLVAFLGRQP